MDKTSAKNLLDLINEHLSSGRFLPEEVLRSPNLLLSLYDFLEYRLVELENKTDKAFRPIAGQKLSPEDLRRQIHEAFSQVKISLRFSAQLLLEQKAQMQRLKGGDGAGSIPKTKSARRPKTKRRPR